MVNCHRNVRYAPSTLDLRSPAARSGCLHVTAVTNGQEGDSTRPVGPWLIDKDCSALDRLAESSLVWTGGSPSRGNLGWGSGAQRCRGAEHGGPVLIVEGLVPAKRVEKVGLVRSESGRAVRLPSPAKTASNAVAYLLS